jgi:plasmid stability protein
MATIQVRNVPSEVHRVYRARAAAAGMSLQEYLLSELERNARLRSPSELAVEVEGRIKIEGQDGLPRVSSAALVRADRASH